MPEQPTLLMIHGLVGSLDYFDPQARLPQITVITADLPLLGQVKPGNHIAFEAVSLGKAHQALADVEKAFLWQKGKLSGLGP